MMQNPYLELEDGAFYKHNFIESNPHEGHKGSKMVWGEKGSFALLPSITSLIYHHLFLSNLHVYLLMIQKKNGAGNKGSDIEQQMYLQKSVSFTSSNSADGGSDLYTNNIPQ